MYKTKEPFTVLWRALLHVRFLVHAPPYNEDEKGERNENINENEKESQDKNVQESLEKNEGNEIKNDENAEANKKEIIKKIIEAITVPNNISIEESQNDPRKKGK